MGRSQDLSQEHYEPGQDVFRQGDLGDRLPVILSGEAEVRREEAGRTSSAWRASGPEPRPSAAPATDSARR